MDALLELAICARGCVASSMSSSRMMVAFVLERVLGQCAEYLAGADDDPIDVAAALVKSRPARDR